MMKIRKAVWAFFMMFTLATTIILFYTVYLFFDVRRAIRIIEVSNFDVEILDSNITDSGIYVTIQTLLTIKNPSRLHFGAQLIKEKLFFDGKPVGKADGYRLSGIYYTPLPIDPFSRKNVTMTMHEVELPVEPTENSEWGVSVLIVLVTPLPDIARLNFNEQYP